MKYNKPLIAALIGALSSIPGEIVTQLFVFLGIGKYSIYQLDSLLITFNRPTEIIGLMVNFIVGSLIGVFFYYALEKLGQDYLVLKGIVISSIFWMLTEFMFTLTVEGKYIDIRPINDYYIHILGAIVFGISLGFLFERYLINKSSPI